MLKYMRRLIHNNERRRRFFAGALARKPALTSASTLTPHDLRNRYIGIHTLTRDILTHFLSLSQCVVHIASLFHHLWKLSLAFCHITVWRQWT